MPGGRPEEMQGEVIASAQEISQEGSGVPLGGAECGEVRRCVTVSMSGTGELQKEQPLGVLAWRGLV